LDAIQDGYDRTDTDSGADQTIPCADCDAGQRFRELRGSAHGLRSVAGLARCNNNNQPE
jgi:hypothetical protein